MSINKHHTETLAPTTTEQAHKAGDNSLVATSAVQLSPVKFISDFDMPAFNKMANVQRSMLAEEVASYLQAISPEKLAQVESIKLNCDVKVTFTPAFSAELILKKPS